MAGVVSSCRIDGGRCAGVQVFSVGIRSGWPLPDSQPSSVPCLAPRITLGHRRNPSRQGLGTTFARFR